jgi:dipeptidyl aminopeptidase/acylaminoacyl peptidase
MVCALFGLMLSVAACSQTAPEQAAAAGQPAAKTDDALPLTLENIYKRGRGGASNPTISPDGNWVTFSARTAKGQGIHRLPLKAGVGGEPQFWTEGGDAVWAPDSRSILVVRGDRLQRIGVDETQAKPLTEAIKGLRAPVFSPDGRNIAFYSTASGHQDIWLTTADGGAPRQLTRESMSEDDGRFSPAWSPDGKTIAFISNKANYWDDDLWVVDVATGAAKQLSRGVTAIGPAPLWSTRGDRIALLGDSKKEYWYLDLTDIFLIDAKTGAESKVKMPLYVTAYNQRTFWSADGERFYFTYQERGQHHIWSVPAAGGVPTRVSNIDGVLSRLDTTRATDAFVFTRGTETEGSEIYYLPAIGGQARRLTNLATKWQGQREPTEISFKSFDGLYMQGFLYLPPNIEGQRCPALVQVHGGGSNSYMRSQNLMEQYLASKGFVVLAINYRGGSGFGREFQDLAVNDWLNGQAKDPGAAADYLRTLSYVNGKVGIYGGSYGGMQSMAAITRTPKKFDAAVPMRGIYSQAMTMEYMDRLGKIYAKTGHGGMPKERPEIYEKSNTINRFSAIEIPLLITHGELDDRAPYKNYELAVAELKRLGKNFESKSYPGEGHGFSNPDNSIDMYQRLESFFNKHLGACAR